MSQHCRANPCCGDVPCRGVPVPQHASGYPSFNPPASADLREENERLKAEAGKVDAYLDADADDMYASLKRAETAEARAATLSAENERLKADLVDAWNTFGGTVATSETVDTLPLMAGGSLAGQIATLSAEKAALTAYNKALVEALKYIAKNWPDDFSARHARAALAREGK